MLTQPINAPALSIARGSKLMPSQHQKGVRESWWYRLDVPSILGKLRPDGLLVQSDLVDNHYLILKAKIMYSGSTNSINELIPVYIRNTREGAVDRMLGIVKDKAKELQASTGLELILPDNFF